MVNTLKRKKEKKKNLIAENELNPFFKIISDNINKGTNAKKIKKLSPLLGQEMNNKIGSKQKQGEQLNREGRVKNTEQGGGPEDERPLRLIKERDDKMGVVV